VLACTFALILACTSSLFRDTIVVIDVALDFQEDSLARVGITREQHYENDARMSLDIAIRKSLEGQ
jgi:hypothetical protein